MSFQRCLSTKELSLGRIHKYYPRKRVLELEITQVNLSGTVKNLFWDRLQQMIWPGVIDSIEAAQLDDRMCVCVCGCVCIPVSGFPDTQLFMTG